VSLYETLLFFHVLGAFALVAGTTAMAPFALGFGQAALERGGAVKLAMTGSILSGIGAVLTLVLGLWLVENAGYEFFRLWILAALVFWAIAGYSNGQISRAARGVDRGEEAGGNLRVVWIADALGATLLLVLMVWKPGH
jgi:uncharacterized membrane protein